MYTPTKAFCLKNIRNSWDQGAPPVDNQPGPAVQVQLEVLVPKSLAPDDLLQVVVPGARSFTDEAVGE